MNEKLKNKIMDFLDNATSETIISDCEKYSIELEDAKPMDDIQKPKRIITQEEYIKDLSAAIDYLEVMNKNVSNVTLNNFIPMMRKKYKLNSQLK